MEHSRRLLTKFRWRPLNPILIRSAGLPVSTLDSLRFVKTTTIVQEVLATEKKRTNLVTRLVREVRCPQAKWLLNNGKRLPLDLVPADTDTGKLINRYNGLCDRMDVLVTQGVEWLLKESLWSSDALGLIAKDYRFQDMVRISTPHASAYLSRLQSEKGLINKNQRKAYLYLQRTTMKVDTAGTFGPIALGQFNYASVDNLKIIKIKGNRNVLIEPWALDFLLAKTKMKVPFTRFFEIALNPELLLTENSCPPSLKQFVYTLSKYSRETNSSEKDKLFEELVDFFQEITGINAWVRSATRKDTAKSYEARSIVFEIAERDFIFEVGGRLGQDILEICQVVGFLLEIATEKMIHRLKDAGFNSIPDTKEDIDRYERIITRYLDESFLQSVTDIINGDIDLQHSQRNSLYPAPPIFSIDLAISCPSVQLLNRNRYVIVLSELHVTPATFTIPFCISNHKGAISEVANAIDLLAGKNPIKLITKEFDPARTFKHNYCDFIFERALEQFKSKRENSDEKNKLVWFHRATPTNVPFSNLLFFPLSIGSAVKIFESNVQRLTYRDGTKRFWTQEELPKMVQKVIQVIDPSLAQRMKSRDFIRISQLPTANWFKVKTPLSLFNFIVDMWRWKTNLYLPDQLFVWCNPVDIMEKPIFVDFCIPHSLHEFYRLLKRNTNPTIVISPIEPPTRRFLLKDDYGRFASELRFTVFPTLMNSAGRQSLIQ